MNLRGVCLLKNSFFTYNVNTYKNNSEFKRDLGVCLKGWLMWHRLNEASVIWFMTFSWRGVSSKFLVPWHSPRICMLIFSFFQGEAVMSLKKILFLEPRRGYINESQLPGINRERGWVKERECVCVTVSEWERERKRNEWKSSLTMYAVRNH